MANKLWCKILSLEGQDVLINRSMDETGELVLVTFFIEGKGTAAMRMSFNTAEEAQGAFYRLSKEDCTNIFSQMAAQMGLVPVEEENSEEEC